ncbi:RsmB/NOP family class I SAM-dependent RNA methyltransferase [Mesorhizobium sp. Z1-4]|uniref:RsmB/NOP family class I SAM-dependent RNA methyltransferase n=1 Tax=Mesorhizobium sp. Z1-4 TaxID=2448478 RepID=UPI000FDBFF3D|nr:RsmB/NOP family class I SAM-dependent RNA methyltransferase [Mesorhizobium sp. Z1-4]
MRLGGRLAAAIEILADIEARYRPAAEALKDWGLSHRFAGSGDRAAIGNIVYDALRRKRSAAWLFDSDAPRHLAFGAVILEMSETAESVNAAIDGDRFAPDPLSADEQSLVSVRLASTPPDEVRADSPDWCRQHLEAAFGEAWVEEAAALSDRPPLDLRVNTLKSDRDKLLRIFARQRAQAAQLAPNAIRIPPVAGAGRHPNVQAEPAFQKGWFEVQDQGSQIAAQLTGAAPGMRVLDFCAGAGGKTLAMSAAMENTGQIHAFDAEKQRLAPIFERLKRAGSRNVQATPDRSALKPLHGSMDIVLVDAPCTGSGTWRRRPDAKWRLTEKQLEQRMAEQSAILDDAGSFVRPGGTLVYVTCSVFDEENGKQAAAFRDRNRNFENADAVAAWQASLPAIPVPPLADRAGGIRMTPHSSDTDGFYVAILKRKTGE